MRLRIAIAAVLLATASLLPACTTTDNTTADWTVDTLTDTPDAIELPEWTAERVSSCEDGLPVFITSAGEVYGDQNRNGHIEDDECDWK